MLNSDPALHPIQSQFTAVYDTLSDSAKRVLLEDHLIPLVDSLPSTSKYNLLSAARSLQAQYTQVIPLPLAAKKLDIDALLEELRLDSYRKQSISRREEIAEEIVDSIIDWLSDIWQMVYEVGVEFEKGHECLVYCCQVLQQIEVVGSGCKCGFMRFYVSVAIKSRSGATVKEFSYSSVDLIEDAFLWIWRDMLLKILAAGRKSDMEAIPRMLRDIQSATKQWETA
ncbi:hypothetical protein JB92DRAFT_3124630 [Gautieria morchelliformis]|nr:hypothetical protein JB92DRAFT_3124630 [Gautieria morchelliformis]